MYFLSVALAAAMLVFPVKDALEQPFYSLSYEEAVAKQTLNDDAFTPVAWSTRPYQLIDNNKGYVYKISSDISRALYTENSRLYLAHVVIDFTPGYAAVQNGMSGYVKNNYLKSGYVHLTIVDSEKSDHANVTSKAMWPKSDDFTSTFQSSYGYEMHVSNIIEEGLEIGNGGILSGSLNGSSETSMSFDFDKSISTITDDPFVSAQYASGNALSATWNFEVLNAEVAGKATYSLEVFYLFEASPKSNKNDKIDIQLSVGLTTQYKIIFGIMKERDTSSQSFMMNAIYM